jgi:hypothetical protein
MEKKFNASQKNLVWTNTLAYSVGTSVTKKKKFCDIDTRTSQVRKGGRTGSTLAAMTAWQQESTET